MISLGSEIPNQECDKDNDNDSEDDSSKDEVERFVQVSLERGDLDEDVEIEEVRNMVRKYVELKKSL